MVQVRPQMYCSIRLHRLGQSSLQTGHLALVGHYLCILSYIFALSHLLGGGDLCSSSPSPLFIETVRYLGLRMADVVLFVGFYAKIPHRRLVAVINFVRQLVQVYAWLTHAASKTTSTVLSMVIATALSVVSQKTSEGCMPDKEGSQTRHHQQEAFDCSTIMSTSTSSSCSTVVLRKAPQREFAPRKQIRTDEHLLFTLLRPQYGSTQIEVRFRHLNACIHHSPLPPTRQYLYRLLDQIVYRHMASHILYTIMYNNSQQQVTHRSTH